MSNQNEREIVGSLVRGGRHERKETNTLRVVAAPENDNSRGRVVGTLVENGGHLSETINNGISFVGPVPSPDLVQAFRNSTPHQSSQQETSQPTNRTSKVSFKVRLVDFKENLHFTYPGDAEVKEVLKEIRRKKGVDVTLRHQNGTDLDPDKTLEQQKVELNQTLNAIKVQMQSCSSAVGSGNADRA